MTDSMENVNREELIKWLRESDGYGILHPDFFTKQLGLPADLVKRYTQNHEGGEGKYAIQSNDGQDNKAFGVSEFAIVSGISQLVGAEPGREYFGRGSQFRSDCAQVLKALNKTALPQLDEIVR